MSEHECPANGCDFTSTTEMGVASHWGHLDDKLHPGSLSDQEDQNPTWNDEVVEERSEKISETLNGRSDEWKDEWKENISKGVVESGANGAPESYRLKEVDGLEHGVRSSWEEEVAFALKDVGVEYEYEKRFEMKNEREYRPDFYTGEVVIEVKGVPTHHAEMKAKEFMSLYSDKEYIVFGNPLYYCDSFIAYRDGPEKLKEVVQ